MFERLGRFTYRRRRWVVVGTLLFVVFAVVWGTGVFGAMVDEAFDDPNSESARAAAVAGEKLGRDEADVIVLYRSETTTVDDPAYQQAVTDTIAALPGDVVQSSLTYWSSGAPQLVSKDRRATYAVLVLRGDEEERPEALEKIEGSLAAPGLSSQLGGLEVIGRDIGDRVGEDIVKAEMLSLPILLVLLLIIFGSLAAASLPLAVGIVAILGAFTAMRVITEFTDVSVFSINLVTILGLGLAIDYGLFMVSRFREELGRTATVEDAVVRTMATAGRTVAVSGLTVAIALIGLLIFPQVFLRSMGLGGTSAVLVAMVAALTLLPALLGILGHRVDALSIRPLFRRLRRRPAVAPTGHAERGAWYRIAYAVMRRPVLYAAGIVVVLVALGLPFLRVEFGGVDYRALPEGTESRLVSETLERDFTRNATAPAEAIVAVPAPVDSAPGRAAIDDWMAAVRQVPGVIGTQITGMAGDTARVAVTFTGDPMGAEGREVLADIRDVPAPPGGQVLVGGKTAELADRLESIGDRLPWMALFVCGITFILLFLAFGSVVLPIKAIVMNVLSLGASFGALVWIFQDGNLSGLLNFTPTGTLEASQPILVLAVVFGLSTDYEVFLLSRVREQYDLTGDNAQAVALGLQRTGRIITSAALLLIVVIGAFSMSGITFIKLIGVAMIIAIVVDATVVRALLVPATMQLLGRANWWAPRPLRGLYARYGIRETDEAVPAPLERVVEPARR
ncbi:MMPL family transporter [Micromonospora sp. WMMD1082]|uniref:MMPL family transporter n=1 Tax=Micromonospora sp. WMMD1082 TaxID=3016104 RepID=UPI002416F1B1|nr:MMPL family transporter [Micromonospora sp. WMMD1082]MDG4794582.1 MMPL family transporter [Micromonospora sp. WMMD1082]